MRKPKYPIGTKFIARSNRKNKQIETIVDIIRWINSNGECIGIRYVCTHEFCGQIVTNSDVIETTISRGVIKE